MNKLTLIALGGIALCLTVVILSWQIAAEPTLRSAGEAEAKANRASGPQKLHARLLDIARTYEGYGRVDDETRWAPYLCRMPSPSRAKFSAVAESEAHGRKLYFLFAYNREAYLAAGKQQQPQGQVIVKEAWLPEEHRGEKMPHPWHDAVHLEPGKPTEKAPFSFGDTYFPYAVKDGKTYKAARKAGLFIMFKTDGDTAGTDEGWVYGTVSADGKYVTAAGKIESCMACHQDAPHGRLFGMR